MMKNLKRLLAVGVMSIALTGISFNIHAQAPAGSAEKAKAEKKAVTKLPFNGTLKSVDKAANTVTVGNRTFKLTKETTYLQGTLDEAKIGEKVGGSYSKSDDGTLTVNSIRFGPKPEQSAKPKKEKKPAAE